MAIRVPFSVLTVAALLAAIAGVSTAWWWETNQSEFKPAASASSDSTPLRFSDDPLPIVYVNSIDVIGTMVDQSIVTPAHLRTELCDALARFDEIIVIAALKCGGSGSNQTPLIGRPERVAYNVSGQIDYGVSQSISVTLRLTEAADGMVVWSRTFPPVRLDANPDAALHAIVHRTVTTIAQPTGVIQAHERGRRTAGAKIDSRYACLLDYNAYRQSVDPVAHERVKACLQQTIAADPTFAAGYTALARIYARQFYTHFGFKK